MSDLQSNVLALLRTAHQEEAAAGFPRLKRIPQTNIIWRLDYFSTLDAAEQDALLDPFSAAWRSLHRWRDFRPPLHSTARSRAVLCFPVFGPSS
jgi:hypothetical protein